MKESTIDIDLDQYDKEHLILFIQYAHERDITVNQAIVQILERFVEQNEALVSKSISKSLTDYIENDTNGK